jgi:crotonobetainyl-CoA:carnitine CoA-transferase CaiB-like acyl-CoA transferase
MQHLAELEEILNGYLRHEPSAVWLQRMEEAGLPAGPVLDILEMQADPQAQARDMILEVDHPVAGRVKTLGHPVKFSETPASVRRAAPVLGQHSREILQEAGYGTAQIESMIAAGAVIAA